MHQRTIGEIARDRRPLTKAPEATVADACAAMHQRRVGAVLVVDPDTLKWRGNPPVLITEVTPVSIGWTDHRGEDPGWVELYCR